MSLAVVIFLPLFAPLQFDSQSLTWQLTIFGKHYFVYNMAHRLLFLQTYKIF